LAGSVVALTYRFFFVAALTAAFIPLASNFRTTIIMKKTPLLALGTLLLVLLLAAWTTPRPAGQGRPLTLDELVDLAGCDKFSCFERKAEALGFRYEDSEAEDDKTAYTFLRSGPNNEQQVLTLYLAKQSNGKNGLSFAVESEQHRSYAGDLTSQATAKGFAEDPANPHAAETGRYDLFTTSAYLLEIHRHKAPQGNALYIVGLSHR
jgi:hypothetical protein